LVISTNYESRWNRLSRRSRTTFLFLISPSPQTANSRRMGMVADQTDSARAHTHLPWTCTWARAPEFLDLVSNTNTQAARTRARTSPSVGHGRPAAGLLRGLPRGPDHRGSRRVSAEGGQEFPTVFVVQIDRRDLVLWYVHRLRKQPQKVSAQAGRRSWDFCATTTPPRSRSREDAPRPGSSRPRVAAPS
jgi:hypothetical protein